MFYYASLCANCYATHFWSENLLWNLIFVTVITRVASVKCKWESDRRNNLRDYTSFELTALNWNACFFAQLPKSWQACFEKQLERKNCSVTSIKVFVTDPKITLLKNFWFNRRLFRVFKVDQKICLNFLGKSRYIVYTNLGFNIVQGEILSKKRRKINKSTLKLLCLSRYSK